MSVWALHPNAHQPNMQSCTTYNDVLSDLDIDDLLIASSSERQHEQHLRLIFQLLGQYGLCVKVDICVLGTTNVKFLGYKISERGSIPLPDWVYVQ